MSGALMAALVGAGASAPPAPGPLSMSVNATVSHGYLQGDGNHLENCVPSIVATPAGGTGPYTFALALISGLPFNVVQSSGPPWTTTFQFNSPGHNQSTYRMTVGDSLGASVFTDITVICN